jgi:hypothetical protein
MKSQMKICAAALSLILCGCSSHKAMTAKTEYMQSTDSTLTVESAVRALSADSVDLDIEEWYFYQNSDSAEAKSVEKFRKDRQMLRFGQVKAMRHVKLSRKATTDSMKAQVKTTKSMTKEARTANYAGKTASRPSSTAWMWAATALLIIITLTAITIKLFIKR